MLTKISEDVRESISSGWMYLSSAVLIFNRSSESESILPLPYSLCFILGDSCSRVLDGQAQSIPLYKDDNMTICQY